MLQALTKCEQTLSTRKRKQTGKSLPNASLAWLNIGIRCWAKTLNGPLSVAWVLVSRQMQMLNPTPRWSIWKWGLWKMTGHKVEPGSMALVFDYRIPRQLCGLFMRMWWEDAISKLGDKQNIIKQTNLWHKILGFQTYEIPLFLTFPIHGVWIQQAKSTKMFKVLPWRK